jgi:hypothetical protein
MANFIPFAELTFQSAPHWDSPMEDLLTVSHVHDRCLLYAAHK